LSPIQPGPSLQVHSDYTRFPKLSYPVVSIGTFDGVHLGHQVILQRLTDLATQMKGQSVVITFHPHPRQVLFPESEHPIQLLSSIDERIRLFEQSGIDHLLIIPFNQDFSEFSPARFTQEVLVKHVGTRALIIGYDHHFGRNREGSFESLKQDSTALGFVVEEIPAWEIDEVTISSTRIRKSLIAGDIQSANNFLGRPYEICGTVVHGEKRGRSIGFPTLNIEPDEIYKLIPANGVYAVRVVIPGKVEPIIGMMNIGLRPTVTENGKQTIEVHLIRQNMELYGTQLRVLIYQKVRDEQKFANLDELRAQLSKDQSVIEEIFT